jgi:3-methyladenine DNA glycosylase AlkD
VSAAPVAALAEAIDAELRAAGSPERAIKERSYLKSEIDHYGTSVPAVRSIAAGVARRHRGLERADVLALADALWDVPVHERRLAAAVLLSLHSDQLSAGDLALLERLLRESRTWALVDTLATSVVAPIVERHPEAAATLERWAGDDDFWIRRSALLAELPALRRGEGDFDRFARHADAMLAEREFFVRKAIGWVLRDTARRRPELVYAWLLPRAARASGVTVREAVKPLDPEQRAAILAAHRRAR